VGEFLAAVGRHTFLQYAIIAGLLASISCGVIGAYVVVRRITYIAGGISHCVLGGIGMARYFQVVYGWESFHPIYGAIIAALLAAAVIGLVSLRAKQREDTVIGAVWAVGMAAGILFISKTPGYQEDLMSYLFGNILMVSPRDLWVILMLDLVILSVTLVFYNRFLAICFDEEFARLRGLRVEIFYLLLLGLTALTVVLLVSVVGIVMVIALLTLPAAIAGQLTKRLWTMMLFSAFLCAILTTAGLALSYGPNLPAGATTIVLAGGLYLLVTTARTLVRRFSKMFIRNL